MPRPNNPSYWGDRLRIRNLLEFFRRTGTGRGPADHTWRLLGWEKDEVQEAAKNRAAEIKKQLAQNADTQRMTTTEKSAAMRKAQAELPTRKIPQQQIRPDQETVRMTQAEKNVQMRRAKLGAPTERWSKDDLDVVKEYMRSEESSPRTGRSSSQLKNVGSDVSRSGSSRGITAHPAERIKLSKFDQIKMRTEMRARSMLDSLKKIGWKKFALSGLAGMAIGTIAFMASDYARDRVLDKIEDRTDLSALLPQNNREAVSISLPYIRTSREATPQPGKVLPFVVEETITLVSPADEVWAFGISLAGLPEVDDNDIDVNSMGVGQSDWLCQPLGGYMICRSVSLSYPLMKGETTKIILRFVLPAEEMKKILTNGSGSTDGYLLR